MKIFAKDKDGHFIREINGIKLPFPLTEFMKMRKWGYVFSALFNGHFAIFYRIKRL